MKLYLCTMFAAFLLFSGCAQTAGNSNSTATSKPYAIYKNPHGYCRLAIRGSQDEKTLKSEFWRSVGYYESAETACKYLKPRGCGMDANSCAEPSAEQKQELASLQKALPEGSAYECASQYSRRLASDCHSNLDWTLSISGLDLLYFVHGLVEKKNLSVHCMFKFVIWRPLVCSTLLPTSDNMETPNYPSHQHSGKATHPTTYKATNYQRPPDSRQLCLDP